MSAPPRGSSDVTGDPGRTSLKARSSNPRPWHEVAPYAFISLVSFLCGVGLASMIVWKAEKLVTLGLIGNLYYIVLLPLGLCASVFLFGILRSYARYRGKVLGGALEVGGPAVIFCLVVIGGFLLPSPQTPFAMTVFVHGEHGMSDLVLKNSGYVVIDLGPDRRRQPIGEKGEAYFSGIPASFRGQKVHLWLESEAFESIEADRKYALGETSLYLAVRPKEGKIFGRVLDSVGNSLVGVKIRVAGLTTTTNESGDFNLAIPGDRMADELDLEAVSSGYAPVRYRVVPNAKATVILSRKR